MQRYRKFIVAVIGLGVLLASDLLNVELGPEAEESAVSLLDAFIAAATAFGVFRATNERPLVEHVG